MIAKIAILAFVVAAATPASAANLELLPSKDTDMCGTGDSKPNNKGVYLHQQGCVSSAWLINHDNNTIYSCFASYSINQDKNGPNVIDEKSNWGAECKPVHHFNVKIDSFAIPPIAPEQSGCAYCGYIGKNWDHVQAQGLWVLDKSSSSIEVCLTNGAIPESPVLFSKCMPATIK